MIRNIIFDMDGVLIDSEEAIREACIKMFEKRAIIAVPEDFIPFTGMGENRFIGGVAEKYSIAFSPEMKSEAYKIYEEIAEKSVTVFPGIKELIIKLRDMGLNVAVASAADEVKVKINLRCIGLEPSYFGAIVTGNDVTKHKPDPEVFLQACHKLGGKAEESIVLEDAVAGCRAAKSAGMTCVGVATTFNGDLLKNAGADFIVENAVGLLPLLSENRLL